MRVAILALPALLLLAPTVGAADSTEGATVGLNLGYESRGLWDLYWWHHPGGSPEASLSWAESLFPGADYDLRLYREGALDDNVLSDAELIAKSQTRKWAPHVETLAEPLPAGLYVLAVVPWQTQAEVYELTASAGDLEFAATAAGVCRYCY